MKKERRLRLGACVLAGLLALAVLLIGCDNPAGPGGGGPEQLWTLSGTVLLPAAAAGDGQALVVLDTDQDMYNGFAKSGNVSFVTDDTEFPFSLANVAAGEYYLYAYVDDDGNKGLNSGDFLGYFGYTTQGAAVDEAAYPPAANLTVSGDRNDAAVELGYWSWSGATVTGSVSLTGAVGAETDWFVFLDADADLDNGCVRAVGGSLAAGTSFTYEIEAPAGTYYLYALLDADASGTRSDGDEFAFYPDTLLPPGGANVTVGATGTVTADLSTDVWPPVFALTVTGDGNGMVTGSTTGAFGEALPIEATPDAVHVFGSWQVSAGTADIADSAAAATTATLTEGDATVHATFARSATSIAVTSPALYQTVSGPSLACAGTYQGAIDILALEIFNLSTDENMGLVVPDYMDGTWSCSVDTTDWPNGVYYIQATASSEGVNIAEVFHDFVLGGFPTGTNTLSGQISCAAGSFSAPDALVFILYDFDLGDTKGVIAPQSGSFPYSYTFANLPDGDYGLECCLLKDGVYYEYYVDETPISLSGGGSVTESFTLEGYAPEPPMEITIDVANMASIAVGQQGYVVVPEGAACLPPYQAVGSFTVPPSGSVSVNLVDEYGDPALFSCDTETAFHVFIDTDADIVDPSDFDTVLPEADDLYYGSTAWGGESGYTDLFAFINY